MHPHIDGFLLLSRHPRNSSRFLHTGEELCEGDFEKTVLSPYLFRATKSEDAFRPSLPPRRELCCEGEDASGQAHPGAGLKLQLVSAGHRTLQHTARPLPLSPLVPKPAPRDT